MPGIAGTIANAIFQGPEGIKYKYMSIMGVDQEDNEVIEERSFQFWPESLSDNISVNWNEISPPGATHSLMSWGGNGGREFSFDITLARFMVHPDDAVAPSAFKPFKLVDPHSADHKAYNVVIEEEIAYLRAYCYPTYENGVAKPPPTALLCMPGLMLNEDGTDVIWCVMTGCDVTILKTFPNGRPRLATVSLSFKQIVQSAAGIKMKDRNDMLNAKLTDTMVGGPNQGESITSKTP